jgi:predicted amidohydrolase YtcJ
MHRTLIALLAALLSAPAAAETLIHNANGIQVGADGKLQRFEALLIGDDGKVVRTFTKVQSPAHSGPRIDAQGRTLLPGLIDAHGHVIDAPGEGMGLGLVALRLDLSATGSIADLQKRLAAYAQANPDAPWIIGRGWNQELFSDRRFPTSADLDAAVADRPVWLERVDGHAAVGNSAALKAAGVTAQSADPSGGRIERGPNGIPTGLFIDNATALVTAKIPEPTSAMMDRALEAAQQALLANGLTAVADMGTSAKGWETMRRLGETDRLKVRIISYSDGHAPLDAIAQKAPTAWLYGDRLRLAGVKLYADGALGSRGAWLKRPYADKPDTRGLRFHSDAELLSLADRAAAARFQVAIHAIGDAANAQVIGAFETLGRTYRGDRRWRIEHVQVVDPADIPRIAPAGIIASMQPTHQTSDRLMAEARLDPPRLAGAYAWQSVLKSGARLAFGSDFPVESPNPFPGLAAAISRQDPNGVPPGGWRPEERVSFEQALAAFTRGAAYAGFAEDRIGSLEPGKWADFIFVDRDPTAIDPQSLAATQVLETWVAGRKVWERSASVAPERGK